MGTYLQGRLTRFDRKDHFYLSKRFNINVLSKALVLVSYPQSYVLLCINESSKNRSRFLESFVFEILDEGGYKKIYCSLYKYYTYL